MLFFEFVLEIYKQAPLIVGVLDVLILGVGIILVVVVLELQNRFSLKLH